MVLLQSIDSMKPSRRVESGSIDSAIEGIANARQALNKDSQMAKEMGMAGYRRVMEKYEWGARAQEIVKTYHSII
jgi:glycosyltransferase involved in cell wall biosynthesis